MTSTSTLTGQQTVQLEYPFPVTIELLYACIRDMPFPVMLSSGDNLGLSGHYDILTAAPQYLLETRGTQTQVTDAEGKSTVSTGNPISVLKSLFGDVYDTEATQASGLPFSGGAIGYFSYDLLHPWYEIASVSSQDISLPAMQTGLYFWSVVVDHKAGTVTFSTLPDCPEDLAEDVLSRLAPEAVADKQQAEPRSFKLTSPFTSNYSPEEYDAVFRRVIEYINAGDCYQVNLAQRFTADYQGDYLTAFTRLQKLANAPFAALMERDDSAVISFSPERFISVDNLNVITQPIKGTRPRSQDPELDKQLLASLLSSKKDQAENLMIVDLLRNDLGRVCTTGSVHVPALFEAQSFNNVHHLVSTVAGKLAKPSDVFDLFAASFPGGSITGAPKIRAMEIINEIETRPRSVYCGSIAWFSPQGNMDSSICIRTLVCSDQQVHCWGGGGVVADSVSEQEYQETLDKITLFLSNLTDSA